MRLTIVAGLAVAATALGQETFRSPEVSADRRVTFRLAAPNAHEVLVSGLPLKERPALTKGDKGIWSVTVGPLDPDLYAYTFIVDGATLPDPRNPQVKVWRTLASLVEVRGAAPLAHELRDVRHGAIHLNWYSSRTIGEVRAVYVYTPPGYEAKAEREYPALYLLHGSGDNEGAWTSVGRAHWIADNLIAEGKVKPMVLVMPYGHVPDRGEGELPERRLRQAALFEKELLEEIIPFVEKEYRVRREAGGRGIAGLSMGGGQAIGIGLNHLDQFSWVAGFSSAVAEHSYENRFGSLSRKPERVNQQLRLLWLGCGKDDFLFERNQNFEKWLTEAGIRHVNRVTEGGHDWRVWRRYLAEVLPLLFAESGGSH